MKPKTEYEKLMESPEFRKLYAVEGLVTEAGELIARLMEEQQVSKAELARRLGKSRAYITQMLRGSANLTLRTLAEVVYALGAEVKLEAVPLQATAHVGTQPEADQVFRAGTELLRRLKRLMFEHHGELDPQLTANSQFAYAA